MDLIEGFGAFGARTADESHQRLRHCNGSRSTISGPPEIGGSITVQEPSRSWPVCSSMSVFWSAGKGRNRGHATMPSARSG